MRELSTYLSKAAFSWAVVSLFLLACDAGHTTTDRPEGADNITVTDAPPAQAMEQVVPTSVVTDQPPPAVEAENVRVVHAPDLPDEAAFLVGRWIADVELELNEQMVEPEELDELRALVDDSYMSVEFGADGSMMLIADVMGNLQEQAGRWLFVERTGDHVRIVQMPYIDGATAEEIAITVLERDVIEVTQNGQALLFYRSAS